MPYKTEGGVKTTDHHIQSPLANIAYSCQVCHRESEETFRSTKQKAQQYLGLDVVQFSKDKDKFKKEVIPLFSPH